MAKNVKPKVTLTEDEAVLLAICFGNYRMAVAEYDRGDGGHEMNDNVVLSGLALLAAQSILGVTVAKPSLVQQMIDQARQL